MNRYLVLVMRNPGFDTRLVPAHREFLGNLRAQQRIAHLANVLRQELAGGFGDASGGAYLLRAASLADARAIAERDPLHVEHASIVTVYEWNAS